MPRPLQCILLVDDDPDDTFLHQLIIDDSDLCDSVRVVETGIDALRYLSETSHPDYIRPDLILTDVHLPGMNGFEFLNQYYLLDEQLKSRFAIMILTTSLDPRDTKQAAMLPYVNGYYTKPLTTDSLRRIVTRCSPTYLNNPLSE